MPENDVASHHLMKFNVIKISLSDCWNAMHATCYFPADTIRFVARVQALAAPTLTLVIETTRPQFDLSGCVWQGGENDSSTHINRALVTSGMHLPQRQQHLIHRPNQTQYRHQSGNLQARLCLVEIENPGDFEQFSLGVQDDLSPTCLDTNPYRRKVLHPSPVQRC